MVKGEKLNMFWVIVFQYSAGLSIQVFLFISLCLYQSPYASRFHFLLSPLKCSALLGYGGKLKNTL